ncbi:shikimate kinase [Bacteriovorax sp. Seq25_V]|uniref:shikimate kinase n=1 Tax=Bacteriovorax sp. Seq25_V TaxID=1201288 RepID=UPI00038A154D|nr:shikimate kinase [Bacteriovorax sp. Seq25_V]EQC45277.1 shikimate kinase [Bacteriovorax sp. Seq25_V]
MKLFICGFSGAGKTTFAEKFSVSDSFGVFDLDEEIFNRMGSGHDHLGDYIEEIGIDEFRKDEIDMIKVLHQNFKDNYLIVLGGGALESSEILEHIKNVDGKLIFINTDFETCYKRLQSVEDRPLMKKGKAFMQDLYNKRLPTYQAADLHLSENDLRGIKTVEELVTFVNK